MLFDTWRPSAPYLVVGIADAVLAVLALGVYFGTRTRGHALASAA
jgi:hypothetical protein